MNSSTTVSDFVMSQHSVKKKANLIGHTMTQLIFKVVCYSTSQQNKQVDQQKERTFSSQEVRPQCEHLEVFLPLMIYVTSMLVNEQC